MREPIDRRRFLQIAAALAAGPYAGAIRAQ
jgi:hypothetical protein